MTLLTDVQKEVSGILSSGWQTRNGYVVPDDDSVQLGNDGVRIDAAVLYADLVASTGLVVSYKDEFAAEVYKAYLKATALIIRARDGAITAYDGDRIMAVFIGEARNSLAAQTALQINWAVANTVNPAIKKQYPNTSFQVNHVVGIDASPLLVAKTGIRGSNDLVWVGPAANYAAKLCDVRESGYKTFLTERVYSRLNEGSKFGGSARQNMWTKLSWRDQSIAIYGSSWQWALV